MYTNRITAYLDAADDGLFPETSMLQDGPSFNNPLVPPANFAPVPQSLLGDLSKGQLSWQQELYRMAYQSALAAVASENLRRAQRN
jgi:hypothetical protein